MPPKGKRPGQPTGKKKASKLKPLDTENDYLEQADEYEQAARKWRAGDATKSLRFFEKARDVYKEGMRKFPTSFDLAYNNAVLLYQISQDTRLATALVETSQQPKLKYGHLLKTALDAHQVAMSLTDGNPDVLFNTAQVLASSAELFSQEHDVDCKLRARDYFFDAVRLFGDCLSLQELQYAQEQSLVQMTDDHQEAQASTSIDQSHTSIFSSAGPLDAVDQGQASDFQDDQAHAGAEVADEQMLDAGKVVSSLDSAEWATVVPPLQPSDIFDTAIAYLETLTSGLDLCAALEPEHGNEQALISLGENFINQRLLDCANLLPETSVETNETPAVPFLSLTSESMQVEAPVQPTSPRADAHQRALLEIARFNISSLQVSYKRKLCNAQHYHDMLMQSFAPLDRGTDTSITVRVAHAEELLEYATTIRENFVDNRDSMNSRLELSQLYINALQRAQEQTNAAMQDLEAGRNLHFPGQDTPAASHILELAGDIALLLYWIMVSEEANPGMQQSYVSLHHKAMGSYHKAAERAVKEGDMDQGKKCRVKETAVRILREGLDRKPDTASAMWSGIERKFVNRTLREMVLEEKIMDKVEYSFIRKHSEDWLDKLE